MTQQSSSRHHRTTLSGHIFAMKACIDNRKKNLLSSNTSSTSPVNMVNFGPLTAEIVSGVWGTPTNFNGFCVLAALLHGIQQWASAKLCGVEQRTPPMFGRATIRLGIGPHSSFLQDERMNKLLHFYRASTALPAIMLRICILSVCPSVCYTCTFCQNGLSSHQTVFTLLYLIIWSTFSGFFSIFNIMRELECPHSR